MSTILVTDGEERASLALVRSLGRAGHRVAVASASGRSLAGASKFAVSDASTPDPLAAPEAFAGALLSLTADRQVDVLVPVSEAALLAVLDRREEFDSVCIPFPDIETLRAVCDKARIASEARSLGIPEPTLARVGDSEELLKLAGAMDDASPAVVKPARSVVDVGGGRRKTAVRYVEGGRELRSLAASLHEAEFPLLIQRRIDGPGVGAFFLVWDDSTLAAFAHRRIREKPPSGGVSVLRESVALPTALRDASEKLLARFGWRGVAMVEFKVEEASGTPYLMEVNGRFWGSLQLAIDAGVDFPRLLVRAACGATVDATDGYRLGVRTRWFWGDVDHLLARMIRSRSDLDLAPTAPGRGRALLDFVYAFGPSVKHEVFRLDDPSPAVRETVGWLRNIGFRA